MARFRYKAKNGPKAVMTGTIDAENEHAALMKLSSMGYHPLSVEKEDLSGAASGIDLLPFLRRIPTKDLSVFTRQLADLLEAGLPLIRALTVLHRQTENARLRGILSDIKDFVQDGNTLSDALKRHPRVFSNFYISMAQSGERGGNMEQVLVRLSEFLESQEELLAKVHAALAYPALMAIVGTITIIVLVTFVIPEIVSMFQDLNQALPLPTMILMNISSFLRNYWHIGLILAALFVFGIRRAGEGSEGKARVDKIKLSLPLFGSLILRTEIARFSRTMATLLNSGVPILEALGVVIRIMESEIMRRELRRAQHDVREGSTLAAGLRKSPYFPPFVTNMIAVGEEGGMLEQALFKVAQAYAREVERTVKMLTSMLEPFMILSMGLIVGFIVIAMLLPIFEINFVAG